MRRRATAGLYTLVQYSSICCEPKVDRSQKPRLQLTRDAAQTGFHGLRASTDQHVTARPHSHRRVAPVDHHDTRKRVLFSHYLRVPALYSPALCRAVQTEHYQSCLQYLQFLLCTCRVMTKAVYQQVSSPQANCTTTGTVRKVTHITPEHTHVQPRRDQT